MRLKKKEREFLRKLLENFIVKNPQFKQCQVVDRFVRERIAREGTFRSSFIVDIFYEGQIEETG